AFQGFVPIELVAAKRPIGRETDFEELDVLPGGVLKHFFGDALHDCRRGDALARDAEGLQNRLQIAELLIDFNVRVESGNVVSGQFQGVFAGNVNDRGRADGPFEMTMELGFGEVAVFWVKAFHGADSSWEISSFKAESERLMSPRNTT